MVAGGHQSWSVLSYGLVLRFAIDMVEDSLNRCDIEDAMTESAKCD
jgi:hypothetical protein